MNSADIKIQNRFLELNKICWHSSLYGHFYPLPVGGPNREARLKLRQTLVARLEEWIPLPLGGAYREQLLTPGALPQRLNGDVTFSISHCQTWAGFIFKLDPNLFLGLDIEQKFRITKKLVSRISRKKEVAGAPSCAFLWGAKESAFKAIPAKPGDLILGNICIDRWQTLDAHAYRFNFCAGAFQGEGYGFEMEDLIFSIARMVRENLLHGPPPHGNPLMKQIVAAVTDPSFNFEMIQNLGRTHSLHLKLLPLPLDYKKLNQVEVLFIRTRVRVDEKLLSEAPNLKVIISGTSGREHVNESLCQLRGIKVKFTGKILAPFVTEYVLLLMLQLSWKILPAMESIQKGGWKDHLARGEGLAGKFLGIVGFGAVGKKLAEKASALGMKVGMYSPNTLSTCKAQKMSLEELLDASDFITLALSFRESNRNFFSKKEFSLMKPSAYFINISRGACVCEPSLLSAIYNKSIQGAALDVFSQEPLPANSPLRQHPSLILTPHFATHNQEALDRLTKKSFAEMLNLVNRL